MGTAMLTETSPRRKARIAGVFYLLTFLMAGVSSVAGGGIAATGNNMLAHQSLFRLGFAADLIVVACYIAVTALFYELFRPVNRSLSLLAAFFSLVGCAIQAFICLFHLVPLVVLGGAKYLSVFKVEQLRALAFLFLDCYGQGFSIALVFFGFYCLLIGYLILWSTFLPRLLGVLMAFAGLAWLTSLSPPFANYLSPYNLAVGALAELTLTLWLLVMGVNAQRWKEQAGAPRE